MILDVPLILYVSTLIIFSVYIIFQNRIAIKRFRQKYENLILDDDDIYIKIKRDNFLKARNEIERLITDEKTNIYKTSYETHKFARSIGATKKEKEILESVTINSVTVDYINDKINEVINKG